MIFKKFYPPFNHRRYKLPKMAQLLNWPVGKSEIFEFKIQYHFDQNDTGGGTLEANLLEGTIIRVWQKDLYANYQ